MKNLLLIGLIGISFQLSAQVASSGVEAQRNMNVLGSGGTVGLVQNFDNRYAGIMGTPYLIDSWLSGDVIIDSVKYTGMRIKYDIANDNLICIRPPQNDSIILNKSKVREFTLMKELNGRRFKKIAGLAGQMKYYEVLYEGKTMLLTAWKKTILKADYSGAYNAGRRYDEFIEKSEQFIRKADGSFHEFKKSKKAILKILGKEAELEAFIKKEKIDLGEPKEVAKLLTYYDSL